MLPGKKILFLFLFVSLLLFFTGGCDSQSTTYTLTVQQEGEGTVTPSLGDHTHDKNSLVDLTATPDAGWQFQKWVGEVVDTGSAETVVLMDRDKTVKAVFFSGIPDDDDDPTSNCASIDLLFSGTEYSMAGIAWNCSGLEGTWQLECDLTISTPEISGTVSGEGSFFMPSRPEFGDWDSLPFGWTMSGPLTGEADADIEYIFQEVIATIVDLDVPPVMFCSGSATSIVTVYPPGQDPITVIQEFDVISFLPSVIHLGQCPVCD